MQYTFMYIDKLIMLLTAIPKAIRTRNDMVKARKAIKLIREYINVLEGLITNHKTTEYLEQLHKVHRNEIDNWAEQIEELFRKLDSLLTILNKDVNKLSSVVENNPEGWGDTINKMSMGLIITGLYDEEKEIQRFRNIAILEIEELQRIINEQKRRQLRLVSNSSEESKQHIESLMNLEEEERLQEYKKYFAELFS